MNLEKFKKVPTVFQVQETLEKEDSRFLRVKIWLMHTGRNYNGSVFSKESVIKAIPSLKNTPILAYVEDNSIGEKDFSDHRIELHVENGELVEKYMGQAIGVIPETNNAQFETRIGDDGVEREYLTVEGLVWAKWEDPIEIFKEYNIKGQSMELHDEFTGKFDENGLFHFDEFKFFGACALGEETLPAMNSATIEAQFSTKDIEKEIQTKLEEFKLNFGANKEEVEVPKKEENVTVSEDKVEDTTTTKDTEETEETKDTVTEDEKVEKNEDETETTKENEDVETKEVESENEVSIDMKQETQAELEALKEKFATLKEEVLELREYKRTRQEGDLKDKFSTKLNEETLNTIFEKMKDASLEDIEKEIYAEIGRLNFEAPVKATPKKDVVKVQVAKKEEPKSIYGNFFNR